MLCYIPGPDLQAELVVMDETGAKGPILALPADKNALSCFLLSHFQVWEIKNKKAAGQEQQVVFVSPFF